ncbi:MAG: hypothetical protein ACOC7V_13925 [Spirochaetota bacterium]
MSTTRRLTILPGLFFHELPGETPTARTASFAEFFPQLGRLIGFATVELGLSSQVAVPVLLAMQTIDTVSATGRCSWWC